MKIGIIIPKLLIVYYVAYLPTNLKLNEMQISEYDITNEMCMLQKLFVGMNKRVISFDIFFQIKDQCIFSIFAITFLSIKL